MIERLRFLFNPARRHAWRALALAGGTLMNAGCALAGPGGPAAESLAETPPYVAEFFEAALTGALGDHKTAIGMLRPLTLREDAPPEVFTALAEAEWAARKPDDCLKTLEQGIAKHPGFIPAYQLRAEINRRRGKIQEAIRDLESALKLEPLNGEMLEQAGILRLRTTTDFSLEGGKGGEESPAGRLIDIYQKLRSVRRGTERIPPIVILSSVYIRAGMPDQAVEAAKEAVAIRQSDPRVHRALAEAYEAAGRPADALDSYGQAFIAEPSNPEVKAKIEELVKEAGAEGGLLAFYEKMAASLTKDLGVQRAYGAELVKAKLWEKAEGHARAALELWPEDRGFKRELVRALFARGAKEEAAKAASELMAAEDMADQELIEMAEIFRSAGEFGEVVAVMRRLAKAHPGNLRLLSQLANLEFEAGDAEAGRKTLEEIVAAKPDGGFDDAEAGAYLVAAARLAAIHGAAGDLDAMLAVYDRAAARLGEARAAEVKMLKAEALWRAGRGEDAIAEVRGMMSGSELPPEPALQMLAGWLARQGRFEEARREVDAYAAKAGPSAEGLAKRLNADLHWRAKEYAKALEILEELHGASPGDAEISKFLAEVYIDAGSHDKALGVVEAVSKGEVSPEDLRDFKMTKARALREQGKLAEAILLVEELLKKDEADERLLLIAGEYYHLAGRIDDAEKALRRAIEANPSNPEAYNALGYFFAEAGIKLGEAQTLVEKALELNPGAGHILDSLGWIHFKKGDYAKAVEHLEAAAEKMSAAPDAVILDHLGDAHAKMGNLAKARAIWSEALKLKPDDAAIAGKLK